MNEDESSQWRAVTSRDLQTKIILQNRIRETMDKKNIRFSVYMLRNQENKNYLLNGWEYFTIKLYIDNRIKWIIEEIVLTWRWASP